MPTRSAAGIPVWIDFEPAIAHNKIIVIDGHYVSGIKRNLCVQNGPTTGAALPGRANAGDLDRARGA